MKRTRITTDRCGMSWLQLFLVPILVNASLRGDHFRHRARPSEVILDEYTNSISRNDDDLNSTTQQKRQLLTGGLNGLSGIMNGKGQRSSKSSFRKSTSGKGKSQIEKSVLDYSSKSGKGGSGKGISGKGGSGKGGSAKGGSERPGKGDSCKAKSGRLGYSKTSESGKSYSEKHNNIFWHDTNRHSKSYSSGKGSEKSVGKGYGSGYSKGYGYGSVYSKGKGKGGERCPDDPPIPSPSPLPPSPTRPTPSPFPFFPTPTMPSPSFPSPTFPAVTPSPAPVPTDDNRNEPHCTVGEDGLFGTQVGLAEVSEFAYQTIVTASVTVEVLNVEILPRVEVAMAGKVLEMLFDRCSAGPEDQQGEKLRRLQNSQIVGFSIRPKDTVLQGVDCAQVEDELRCFVIGGAVTVYTEGRRQSLDERVQEAVMISIETSDLERVDNRLLEVTYRDTEAFPIPPRPVDNSTLVPTPSPSDDIPEGGLDTWMIALIAAGGAVICCFAYVCLRRPSHSNLDDGQSKGESESASESGSIKNSEPFVPPTPTPAFQPPVSQDKADESNEWKYDSTVLGSKTPATEGEDQASQGSGSSSGSGGSSRSSSDDDEEEEEEEVVDQSNAFNATENNDLGFAQAQSFQDTTPFEAATSFNDTPFTSEPAFNTNNTFGEDPNTQNAFKTESSFSGDPGGFSAEASFHGDPAFGTDPTFNTEPTAFEENNAFASSSHDSGPGENPPESSYEEHSGSSFEEEEEEETEVEEVVEDFDEVEYVEDEEESVEEEVEEETVSGESGSGSGSGSGSRSGSGSSGSGSPQPESSEWNENGATEDSGQGDNNSWG